MLIFLAAFIIFMCFYLYFNSHKQNPFFFFLVFVFTSLNNRWDVALKAVIKVRWTAQHNRRTHKSLFCKSWWDQSWSLSWPLFIFAAFKSEWNHFSFHLKRRVGLHQVKGAAVWVWRQKEDFLFLVVLNKKKKKAFIVASRSRVGPENESCWILSYEWC